MEHPAAKVLCELADLQDKEVGDGTTSVVGSLSRWLKTRFSVSDGQKVNHTKLFASELKMSYLREGNNGGDSERKLEKLMVIASCTL